ATSAQCRERSRRTLPAARQRAPGCLARVSTVESWPLLAPQPMVRLEVFAQKRWPTGQGSRQRQRLPQRRGTCDKGSLNVRSFCPQPYYHGRLIQRGVVAPRHFRHFGALRSERLRSHIMMPVTAKMVGKIPVRNTITAQSGPLWEPSWIHRIQAAARSPDCGTTTLAWPLWSSTVTANVLSRPFVPTRQFKLV